MVLNEEQTYLLWSAARFAANHKDFYSYEERQELKKIAEYIQTIQEAFIAEKPF